MTIQISVQRFDPESGREAWMESYAVPSEEGGTVLGALLHIYEHYDSTVAFRYGCRNTACGLCAMEIDGKPAVACTTTLADGMLVRPLPKLPVARDLIVERGWIAPFLKRYRLFVPETPADAWPGTLCAPPEHSRLLACTECLICLANCPHYEYEENGRGGPYHFVKLGQMHWDPRNTVDRRAQAVQLGIERCAACGKCRCPFGVPIYSAAIKPLL